MNLDDLVKASSQSNNIASNNIASNKIASNKIASNNITGKISKDILLAPFTWLRVGGQASYLYMPADENDLCKFLQLLPEQYSIFILGVGSNVLISDEGIKGVVIKLGAGFSGVMIDGTKITVGSAMLDMKFAKIAAKNGLAGAEFFCGIPGTIGGAVKMNAGCYGGETYDKLLYVNIVKRDGKKIKLMKDDISYAYRHASIDDEMCIVSACFELTIDDPEKILQRMQAITKQRQLTQPIKEKTSGSTFRNPDITSKSNLKAWQLIDASGARGYEIGGAKMSDKHCNFLINYNEATANDLYQCANDVSKMVMEKFNIKLIWEVKQIGFAQDMVKDITKGVAKDDVTKGFKK